MQNYSAKLKKLLIFSFVFALCTSHFTLAVHALSNPAAKITQAIEDSVYTKYPDWVGLKIDVELKYAQNLEPLLKGFSDKADLQIVGGYKSFRPVGNVIFPIVVTEGKMAKRIFVRAKVAVFDFVVAAKETISRRDTVTEAKLFLESRDIAMMPAGAYNKLSSLVGKEAKTSIPKGSTIYEWMVKDIPVVRNGDSLTVVVISDNLEVKTKGTALMDGYIGQAIKVKTAKAKDPLEGILKNAGLVEVTLK